MTMNIQDQLKQRFVDAIKKALSKPTPLIGGKWFKFNENGKPADFQFTGCTKLAKATVFSPQKIINMLSKHLDLSDISASVTITEDFNINVMLKPGNGAQ